MLVKYDFSLRALWARAVDSLAGSEFSAVGTDAEGNIYAAGYITGGTSPDRAGSISVTTTYASGILAKYDSSGTTRWARTITGGPD